MSNEKSIYSNIIESLHELTEDEKLQLLSEIKESTNLNVILPDDANNICDIIYEFNNTMIQYYRNRTSDFIGNKSFDMVDKIISILNKSKNTILNKNV